MPQGKPYPKEFRLNAVETALKEKIDNNVKYKDTAEKLGVDPTLLSRWINEAHKGKFADESPPSDLVSDITDELNDSYLEGKILINDEYRRETVATALFMSGYIIWQTVEGGNVWINYEMQ